MRDNIPFCVKNNQQNRCPEKSFKGSYQNNKPQTQRNLSSALTFEVGLREQRSWDGGEALWIKPWPGM